jgi:hypothetical protein
VYWSQLQRRWCWYGRLNFASCCDEQPSSPPPPSLMRTPALPSPAPASNGAEPAHESMLNVKFTGLTQNSQVDPEV